MNLFPISFVVQNKVLFSLFFVVVIKATFLVMGQACMGHFLFHLAHDAYAPTSGRFSFFYMDCNDM